MNIIGRLVKYKDNEYVVKEISSMLKLLLIDGNGEKVVVDMFEAELMGDEDE